MKEENSMSTIDYLITATDLARYVNEEEPRLPIRDLIKNKEVIFYLVLWESIHNENFKEGRIRYV